MTGTAILPALTGDDLAGSTRLFLGQPAILRPIAAALASGLFARVIVLTADAALADAVHMAGATVAAKPMAGVLAGLGLPAAALVAVIQPTALFLRAADLAAGAARLAAGDADFVQAVASYPAPVQRALVIRDDRVRMLRQENLFLRSQDLTEASHDARLFRLGHAAGWVAQDRRGERVAPLAVPRHLAPVLRSADDWARAEVLAQVLDHAETGAAP